jgi:hypothetical protein
MEGLIQTGSVVLGLLLRLGIPILVTLVFVRFLRRLDERWQREGVGEVQTQPQEAPLFSSLRCWMINDCTADQKKTCPAFLEAGRPCWQVYRVNGSVKEECLACEVFQKAPVPVPA